MSIVQAAEALYSLRHAAPFWEMKLTLPHGYAYVNSNGTVRSLSSCCADELHCPDDGIVCFSCGREDLVSNELFWILPNETLDRARAVALLELFTDPLSAELEADAFLSHVEDLFRLLDLYNQPLPTRKRARAREIESRAAAFALAASIGSFPPRPLRGLAAV